MDDIISMNESIIINQSYKRKSDKNDEFALLQQSFQHD